MKIVCRHLKINSMTKKMCSIIIILIIKILLINKSKTEDLMIEKQMTGHPLQLRLSNYSIRLWRKKLRKKMKPQLFPKKKNSKKPRKKNLKQKKKEKLKNESTLNTNTIMVS